MIQFSEDAQKIEAAYDEYLRDGNSPNGYATVAGVREYAGLPRHRFNVAALELMHGGRFEFVEEVNQKTLTEGLRAGAMEIGGQANHLMVRTVLADWPN